MNPTQQRFQGYQQTPLLWKEELLGLRQLSLSASQSLHMNQDMESKLRLGNYVERLVSYELQQDPSVEILQENIQIITHKTTLGELDCLLTKEQQPIHLEIAYKFYLYDPTVGSSFLEHWIGPNRRDSLVLKLNKIKDKQFPLLYSEACRPFLKELNLEAESIDQRTLFKAQLYVPFQSNVDCKELNQECVFGFYINKNQLSNFKDGKFYIPRKLDWLIEPNTQVDWMNAQSAQQRIQEFHEKKSTPLCWIKAPNGEIYKVFVTWWKH
jgi:hypothetical protein